LSKANAQSHTHCQVAQNPAAKTKTWQRVCLLPTLASLRKEKPDR